MTSQTSNRPRILFYDIETTDLDGDFGNLVAFGYKWQGGKATVLSLLDVSKPCKACKRVGAVDDAALVKATWGVLATADVWVTWYGKGFDAKFLNTRILDAGLPPLPDVPHVDLYWTARGHLKLSSNRLANVQNFLQLPTSKTPITRRTWRRAQAGDVPSIKYIIEHCARDVDVLEQAYERLKPYVRTHPRVVPLRAGCRVCGGKLTGKGVRITVTRGPRQRLICLACGHCETVAIGKAA